MTEFNTIRLNWCTSYLTLKKTTDFKIHIKLEMNTLYIPLCLPFNTGLTWSQSSELKAQGQPWYDMSKSVGLALGLQPHWLCPLPSPFGLGDRRDMGPDMARLHLRLVPSFIPPITQPGPTETCPRRNTTLSALTGPRSDQAWREGSSSSLTSTCYDLWAESKKAPWLDLSRQCLWKLSLHWVTVAWKREERGQAAHRQEKAKAREDGEMRTTTTLGVQMARCLMCGLNG